MTYLLYLYFLNRSHNKIEVKFGYIEIKDIKSAIGRTNANKNTFIILLARGWSGKHALKTRC